MLVTDGAELKKVPVAGGQAIPLADDPVRGADWGPSDTIVLGGDNGLMTISASGGDTTDLIVPGGEPGLRGIPKFLPHGRAVLYYIWNGAPNTSQVAVYDFDTEEQKTLLSGTSPQFAASGHLIFFRDGSLWAVAFDSDRLEVEGEPRVVVEGVAANSAGWANYSVSREGTWCTAGRVVRSTAREG